MAHNRLCNMNFAARSLPDLFTLVANWINSSSTNSVLDIMIHHDHEWDEWIADAYYNEEVP